MRGRTAATGFSRQQSLLNPPLSIEALEQQALAAHDLYLASLARAEHMDWDHQCGGASFNETDMLSVGAEINRNRNALRDALDRLGYLPQCMAAKAKGIKFGR